MTGDRMVGSSGDVNQGTTAGGDKRCCRGQSVRSSEEAGNDRGAKERRKAVPEGERRPSREGRRSAVRLCASARRRTAWPPFGRWQWAVQWGPPIEVCRPESRMREIRPSGLGGRGSAPRSSYPHSIGTQPKETIELRRSGMREGFGALHSPPCLTDHEDMSVLWSFSSPQRVRL